MKPSKAVIAGAAVAGFLTGSFAVRAYAASTSGHAGVSLHTVADAEKALPKHACKGQNECKGQGGCKSGGCPGQNSCKGKGGAVGRHYMGHVNSVLMAVSKCPNPTVFQKTLSVNDFYFGSKEWDFPMGHISFVGKLDGETLKAGAPPLAPGFTLDLMANHSLDFWLTSEDLPDPDNRVTLDRSGNIVLTYEPNNVEGHKRLTAKLEDLLKGQRSRCFHGDACYQGLFARSLFIGRQIALAGVAHQNGTIRFGHDPKTSALDVNCKTHDVDNLYVIDSSFFPSSGAVNPGLTIMANALRVGENLVQRLG